MPENGPIGPIWVEPLWMLRRSKNQPHDPNRNRAATQGRMFGTRNYDSKKDFYKP